MTPIFPRGAVENLKGRERRRSARRAAEPRVSSVGVDGEKIAKQIQARSAANAS